MKLYSILYLIGATLTTCIGYNIADTKSEIKIINSSHGTNENPVFFGYEITVTQNGR